MTYKSESESIYLVTVTCTTAGPAFLLEGGGGGQITDFVMGVTMWLNLRIPTGI